MKNINHNPLVSILIVNFNGRKYLNNLFKSLLKQSYQDYEILFFDNNSTDESLEIINSLKNKYQTINEKLKIIKSDSNLGFAKANNILAEKANGLYLLFINTDIILDENGLNNMINTITCNNFIAGVAPKIYLSRHLPLKIFDSVGICMDHFGSPYNRGIGQIDLGQYDFNEEILGPCFACCLVKKSLFIHNRGLDDSFFAYFEDVDWDFRTRKEGYVFYSCPKAIAYHYHSGTSNKNSYEWKYYLIFRNYLRTAIKTYGKRTSLRIVTRKIKDLSAIILLPNSQSIRRLTALRIIMNFILLDWWRFALKRKITRKDFVDEITDDELFAYGDYEPSIFFNPQTYQPETGMMMLNFIVNKVNYLHENKEMLESWYKLKNSFFCAIPNTAWVNKFSIFVKKYLKITLTKEELQQIFEKLLYVSYK